MSQEREVKTIQAMVEIYCRAHHGRDRDQLCEACQTLFEYAQARLGKCPFGPEKPVCANCPIHCYRPEMRDQIREVMRYSGPRMARPAPRPGPIALDSEKTNRYQSGRVLPSVMKRTRKWRIRNAVRPNPRSIMAIWSPEHDCARHCPH